MIAGVLPNTPENLEQWLRDPQRFAPGSAMPADTLSDQEAKDAAAYLESLTRAP
jgi:cytochrome c1